MVSTNRCYLLDLLPPEIRLRIYDQIFDSTNTASLLIRSNSKIEIICSAKAAHAALLKTCRTIYTEAAPVLFNATTFRVQIYPVDGYPSSGNGGRLGECTPFLGRIRHMEIKCCVIVPSHAEPALRLMRAFATALEDAGAEIKTLHVRSKLFPDVCSNRRLFSVERKLGDRSLDDGEQTLFHRMLCDANPDFGRVAS